jgi:broad-specificity NMP kinase
MTLKVAVIGIDGSGKSTLARALPMALAADCGVVAGSAGEDFWVFGPDEDHMAPGFHPRGMPHAARIALLCRSLAKRAASNPRLYPYLKLAHMMFQDDAAESIARRYGCEVMVSDCNLILSAMGRASNYRRGATHDGLPRERSRVEDLEAVLAYLIEGTPLPAESAARLPSLGPAGLVTRLARTLGFDGVGLPDVVIFLDADPEAALGRVASRGAARDRHENLSDMTRARETYLKALRAFAAFHPSGSVHVIDVTDAEPREVLAEAVNLLRARILERHPERHDDVLGTPEGTTARRVLSAGYVFRYLVPRLFSGAWREPLFLLSPMGRRLLQEGYSAGVMQVIYDSDFARQGPFARAFLGYPLHRAVHDRLRILVQAVESELSWRLEQHERVRIFTAPSGFAYDVFQPLERIAAYRPELMRHVELIAADLDPHGELAGVLEERAARLGIGFRLVVGDLTEPAMRRRLADYGPFDVALFVGLSSWLPRTETMQHLRWLAGNLRGDGLLISDCFSAAPYSLGGRLLGYRAHYYSPELYRRLLDYCGFDGRSIEIESGAGELNHVVIAEPRPQSVPAPAPAAARTGSAIAVDSGAGMTARRRDTAVSPTTPAAPARTAEPMKSVTGPRTP